ncbi:hypothetical protein ACLOJK_028721 [Asimina triloba]
MATFSSSHAAPTGNLRKKIAELEKIRKLGKKRNPKKDDFIVYVPESLAFLDTASMPMVLTAVAVALFAKVLMMYDESKAQEMIERKIQHAPPEQGTVRMLSREEWDEIQEIRPRTPFESKLARPNARLRTGEPLRMEDVKDWTIDVLTDALARAEETVRRGTKESIEAALLFIISFSSQIKVLISPSIVKEQQLSSALDDTKKRRDGEAYVMLSDQQIIMAKQLALVVVVLTLEDSKTQLLSAKIGQILSVGPVPMAGIILKRGVN